jgi:3-oxoacyl-[acyl-carrier-protein] synthase-1
LSWPTLSVYERASRLLTATNSNGFMPGEAGGAILVGRPSGEPELLCTGLGYGVEQAHIDSEEPLRADGLSTAFRQALADAGCALNALDFRITDVSGEQYYFKEAALALQRTMRARREEFDFWHPAECIGEAGAACGPAIVALADAACRKSYAPGRGILGHMGIDAGRRAAMVMVYSADLPERQ